MTRELLIIGGYREHGGGGIGTFVHEQEEQLSGYYNIRKHNQTATHVDSTLRKIFLTIYKLSLFIFTSPSDVVHINTTSGKGFYRDSIYILFISYIWRRPIVLRTGGSGFDEFVTTNSFVKSVCLKIVFSNVASILVLTELQYRVLRTYVPIEKVTLFPQATEVDNYAPKYSQKPHILFLSSLSERKGFHLFANAIDTLFDSNEFSRDEILVSLAGDGEYQEVAEELDTKYECITYHGYVSGQEKYDLLNNASIFILPTHAEGFPNAIIEAMAGGCAIISTTASGIPEIVTEDCGVTIEPGNTDQLFEALVLFLESHEMVEAIGKHNHKKIKENYNWESAREQLLKVYEDALGR
ncbi:glycosyltransferase family 4 protein [Natrialbaceae archaeon A-CW1-1]